MSWPRIKQPRRSTSSTTYYSGHIAYNEADSLADLVLQFRNLLACLHYLLLDLALFALQFYQLPLHVIVVLALLADLRLQVIKVLHQLRIHELHVLIVQCGQVVVHKRYLLPQQVNFFLVFAHILLT